MGRNSSGGQRKFSSPSPSRSSGSSGRISGGRTRSVSTSSSRGNATRHSSPSPRNNASHHSSPPPRDRGARHNSPPPPNGGFHHGPAHHMHHSPPPPAHGSMYSSPRPRRRGSCGSYLFVLILIVVIFVVVKKNDNRQFQTETNTPNTWQKETTQTQTQAPSQTNTYYSDELGWFSNQSTLLSGFKTFEEKTGVTPFLYLTDNVNGNNNPTEEELDAYANELYDKLFTDENHFLLIFLESGDYYMTWYVCGSDAATIVDISGAEIVLDNVDLYYSDTDMTDEEYFSTVFSKSAESIMENK